MPSHFTLQFGLETEIGITRDRAEDIDVVAESIALVRSATVPGVRMRWNYRDEDPHQDARGFRVQELRQDTDEANYFAQDASRPLSFAEIKSDLVLRNGARFYNDHAHPEYCTPECSTLLELLQQDFAGRCVADAVRGSGEFAVRQPGAAIQEQHGFPRPQLWVSRELLDAAITALVRVGRRHSGVFRYAADFLRSR